LAEDVGCKRCHQQAKTHGPSARAAPIKHTSTSDARCAATSGNHPALPVLAQTSGKKKAARFYPGGFMADCQNLKRSG